MFYKYNRPWHRHVDIFQQNTADLEKLPYTLRIIFTLS